MKTIERLPRLGLEDRERVRRRLREQGVIVVCADMRLGRLEEVVGRREAEEYVRLVEEGYGLAQVGWSVILISPESPLKGMFGVAPHLLDGLRRAAGTV